MVKQYRRKPNIIDAIMYDGDNADAVGEFRCGTVLKHDAMAVLVDAKAKHNCTVTVWLNQYAVDIDGEIRLMTDTVFNLLYEEIKKDKDE